MAMASKVAASTGFLSGTKVASPRPAARRPLRAARPVTAKYGQDSQYFDLDDLENTVGSWDLYGVEDSKRYPQLQADFFERSAGPLTRREAMFSFLSATGAGALLIWGGKGSKDAKLPITRGPSKPATPGPRGRI